MKTLIAVLLFLSTATFSFGGDMLATGSLAPEFSLPSHDDDTVSLSSFKGKKYVVLIFYPGDETPVCTQQLCEIRDDYSQFEQRGAVVFGVNPGSEKSHQKFVQKHSFQFKLLIDSKGTVAKLYSAKGALMNQRTVYVIDKEGKIIFAQRGKPPVTEILSSIPQQQ
ncbi:MAG TPA: peroxiredoxin [Chitinispirillaceae bacterium]|nr:peroxiredoxin [Chitinispirillaceae bacterium]